MTTHSPDAPSPELSRSFAVDELGYEPAVMTVEATAAECAALAARFDLQDLRRLSAQLRLRWRQRSRHLEVTGSLEAELVQTCVVSLEPVESRINDRFRAEFVRGLETPAEVDLILDPGNDDPPEPLEGPVIDLGELVAQHLSLAIDPYPRADGVSLDDLKATLDSPADTAAENPFNKLAALQQKR